MSKQEEERQQMNTQREEAKEEICNNDGIKHEDETRKSRANQNKRNVEERKEMNCVYENMKKETESCVVYEQL